MGKYIEQRNYLNEKNPKHEIAVAMLSGKNHDVDV